MGGNEATPATRVEGWSEAAVAGRREREGWLAGWEGGWWWWSRHMVVRHRVGKGRGGWEGGGGGGPSHT